MFNLYDYLWGWDYLSDWYPKPRALTANQIRVKRIKAKIKARKMLATKKGKRQWQKTK